MLLERVQCVQRANTFSFVRVQYFINSLRVSFDFARKPILFTSDAFGVYANILHELCDFRLALENAIANQ